MSIILLSHGLLTPVYRPWSQLTADGSEVLALLSRFRRVICLHGHTHTVASEQ